MIFSCNTSSLLQYGGGSEIKGCDLFGSFIQKCFVWSFVRSTFLNAWSMYREGLEQGASYSCFDYIKRPIYMHTILQQGLASCFNVSVISGLKMKTHGLIVFSNMASKWLCLWIWYTKRIMRLIDWNNILRFISSPWLCIYKNENGRVFIGQNTHLSTHSRFFWWLRKNPWPFID